MKWVRSGSGMSRTRLGFAAIFLLVQSVPATGQEPVLTPPGGYVRDRRLNEALAALQRLEKAGSGQDFATVVQWILDQPRDSIVVEADGRPASVRLSAERILSRAGPERLEDYRRLHGPAAATALADARKDDRQRGLWAVVRRYFLTEAGGQAAVELIVRGLDSGADSVVSAIGSRLLREPAHAALLTPALRRRLEMASTRATQVVTLPNSDTTGPSAAVMLRPEWTIPLDVRQLSNAVNTRWKLWQNQLRDNEQSTAIAAKPLVVSDLILFRDGNRLRAVESRTGKKVWEQTTDLGWEPLASGFSGGDVELATQRRASLIMDWLVSNSTYFSLTTNGRQVFLVDRAGAALEALTSERGLRELPDEQQREALTNDVVAIDLDAAQNPDSKSLSWSLRERTGGERSPFRNHTFLGPPAASPGLVVVLSEVDREVGAAAVDSETGEVHWIQPVAEPDSTILDDRERFKRSCTPVLAGGLVLCPTQLGSLVALDLTTGAIAWVHAHYDPRPVVSRPAAYRSMAALPQTRNAAFNARPWVSGSRVLFLTGQSDALYCLDLESGRSRWSASQPDTDAIATVTDSAVILLGRTAIRALSLENGAEVWSTRLPVPPSGEAVAYQGELVVPLSKGTLWRLRLDDGALLSRDLGHVRHATGHLAVAPDGIIALGADGLSAYRFTSVVRRELETVATTTSNGPAGQFQFAEVALAEGRLTDAVKFLETVRTLDADWRGQTDPLLREAYFSLLRTDLERRAVWLDRLRPLCRTGDDYTRWLIARGEWQIEQSRTQELSGTVRELAEQPGSILHEVATDPALAVSGARWLRRTLRHTASAQKSELTRIFATEMNDLTFARTVEMLFPQTPLGEGVRPRLAQEARTQGRYHAAETWLMRNAESTEVEVAAAAVRQLSELYTESGMANAAAAQWDRLATEFATVDCGGTTGRTFVQERTKQGGAVMAAYRRQAPITWPLVRAQVAAERREPSGVESAERVGNPQRELVFQAERYARWRTHPREDSDFEWTQRMEGAESYLLAWDRYAQHPRFHVSIPQGVIPFAPAFGRLAFERAIPIGVPAEMRMISVMQPATDGEAWSRKLPEWEDRSAVPLIGPGTLRLQLFQLRSTLVAVDPADGQVLWRRNDLEPNSGLVDRAMGIFADDQVVGVLGADRVSYRLLDAATGDVVRTGKLEADRSSLRFAAGTRLIWVIEGNDGKRVRIWDAAEDRIIFEDTVRERQYVRLSADRELIWLSADDHLCILDVKRNQMLARCPLDPSELTRISSFNVFRQAGRYYLNLGRTLPTARTEHYHSALNDHALPVTPLRDDLLAIDQAGTAIAWKRTLPQTSILSWGRLPVPVLVSMSKVRHKADNNHEWLRVDVHDAATGQRLGSADLLPKDRWVHADYDGSRGEIRVYGLQHTIRIRFDESMQQLPDTAEIL